MTFVRAIASLFALALRWMLARISIAWDGVASPLRTDVEARNFNDHRSVKSTTSLLSSSSSSSEQQLMTGAPGAAVIARSPLYLRLVRGLRDRDARIEALDRRVAFLRGEIRLKDLRIANLVCQASNFTEIGLQRTRPYVTGSKQPRLKTKMPSSQF